MSKTIGIPAQTGAGSASASVADAAAGARGRTLPFGAELQTAQGPNMVARTALLLTVWRPTPS